MMFICLHALKDVTKHFQTSVVGLGVNERCQLRDNDALGDPDSPGNVMLMFIHPCDAFAGLGNAKAS